MPEIGVDELDELCSSGQPIQLIDVRELDEYQDGHVPGAKLIPLATVPDRLRDIATDRPIYVICRSGARSRAATEVILANGTAATNVAGGTLAWIESGRAVVYGADPS